MPFTPCQDPSIIWSFRPVEAKPASASFYELTLAAADHNIVATRFWTAKDFPIFDDGASTHQAFTGDPNFTVGQS